MKKKKVFMGGRNRQPMPFARESRVIDVEADFFDPAGMVVISDYHIGRSGSATHVRTFKERLPAYEKLLDGVLSGAVVPFIGGDFFDRPAMQGDPKNDKRIPDGTCHANN